MKVIIQGFRSRLVVTQGYLAGEPVAIGLVETGHDAGLRGAFVAALRGLFVGRSKTTSKGGRA